MTLGKLFTHVTKQCMVGQQPKASMPYGWWL